MGLKTKKLEINGVEYDLTSDGSGSNINIVDNLESTDSNSALSANQGKILNDKINFNIENLEAIKTQTVVGSYDEDSQNINIDFNVPIQQGIVEDTLESDNSYNALSAKQGKILNEKINDVEDDVNEINSNLSRKGVVFLANCTQQTDTTYTVISLKSFDLLLLTVGYRGTQSRGTIIVPTVHFINSGYINAQFYNEVTSEHVNADCTYISDTSVLMKTTHANQHGTLYGIKL